jgi:CheY-like chemotaxis protein
MNFNNEKLLNEVSVKNEALIASEKVKSDFLATMSHEIRTPMNGVIGVIDLLKHTPLTGEQSSLMETLKMCGTGLITIVNDILDYSKLEAGKLQLDDVNFSVKTCVKDVIYLYRKAASDKNLELIYEVQDYKNFYLIGDDTRIRQILFNLVSNAIKFTAVGKVILNVEMVKEDGGNTKVTFSVTDEGIGIAPEDHHKVFQSFTQVDSSTSRHYGGTGLGLAISFNLAKMMNGRLWFESDFGLGTTFYLELSLKQGSLEKETLDLEIEGQVDSNLRVLIVEDNVVNQKIAKAQLQKIGLAADIANHGQEALDILVDADYDVIFMDIQMPILDGIEATKKIILKYGSNRPYIVAMTANVLAEDRQRCFDAGMDDFIGKPISKKDIINSIKSLISKFEPFVELSSLNHQAIELEFGGFLGKFEESLEEFNTESQKLLVAIQESIILENAPSETLVKLELLKVEFKLIHAVKCEQIIIELERACKAKDLNKMALYFNDIKDEIEALNQEFLSRIGYEAA